MTPQNPSFVAPSFIPFGYLPAPWQFEANPEAALAPNPSREIGPIRIYVACLAAYNAGCLHGWWIDATQGEDQIWDEVRAMLKASPEPDAEEWAIHDYEGFEGAPVSEWTGFDTIAELADFIEEHETLGGKLLAHYGGDLQDAKRALENYAGEYESLEDYARQLSEETGAEIPDHLANYIDYAAMGSDMEAGGDVFAIETAFDEIHIFWAH